MKAFKVFLNENWLLIILLNKIEVHLKAVSEAIIQINVVMTKCRVN